ncbi:Protein CL16A [Entophlyctis luteolus]|nr:Protein CL16A [Entophlyctis luteolus]
MDFLDPAQALAEFMDPDTARAHVSDTMLRIGLVRDAHRSLESLLRTFERFPPPTALNLQTRRISDILESVASAVLAKSDSYPSDCDLQSEDTPISVFFELSLHRVILRLAACAEFTTKPSDLLQSILTFFSKLTFNLNAAGQNREFAVLLLSNNFMNEVIAIFGSNSLLYKQTNSLEDDSSYSDICCLYSSLLKNLSCQLSRETVPLFLNQKSSFPLLDEALWLISFKEAMARVSGRVVALNIIKSSNVDYPEGIQEKATALYLETARLLDSCVQKIYHCHPNEMQDLLEEAEDIMHFMNEVFVISHANSLLKPGAMHATAEIAAGLVGAANLRSEKAESNQSQKRSENIALLLLIRFLTDFERAEDHATWTSQAVFVSATECAAVTLNADAPNPLLRLLVAAAWLRSAPCLSPAEARYWCECLVAFLHTVCHADNANACPTVGVTVPPACIDICVSLLEQLHPAVVVNGDESGPWRDMREMHEEWTASIRGLLDNQVDSVMEMLEYESSQPRVTVNDAVKFARQHFTSSSLKEGTAPVKENTAIRQIRELWTLVRCWLTTRHFFSRVSLPHRKCDEILPGVGNDLEKFALYAEKCLSVDSTGKHHPCALHRVPLDPTKFDCDLTVTHENLILSIRRDSDRSSVVYSRAKIEQVFCSLDEHDPRFLRIRMMPPIATYPKTKLDRGMWLARPHETVDGGGEEEVVVVVFASGDGSADALRNVEAFHDPWTNNFTRPTGVSAFASSYHNAVDNPMKSSSGPDHWNPPLRKWQVIFRRHTTIPAMTNKYESAKADLPRKQDSSSLVAPDKEGERITRFDRVSASLGLLETLKTPLPLGLPYGNILDRQQDQQESSSYSAASAFTDGEQIKVPPFNQNISGPSDIAHDPTLRTQSIRVSGREQNLRMRRRSVPEPPVPPLPSVPHSAYSDFRPFPEVMPSPLAVAQAFEGRMWVTEREGLNVFGNTCFHSGQSSKGSEEEIPRGRARGDEDVKFKAAEPGARRVNLPASHMQRRTADRRPSAESARPAPVPALLKRAKYASAPPTPVSSVSPPAATVRSARLRRRPASSFLPSSAIATHAEVTAAAPMPPHATRIELVSAFMRADSQSPINKMHPSTPRLPARSSPHSYFSREQNQHQHEFQQQVRKTCPQRRAVIFKKKFWCNGASSDGGGPPISLAEPSRKSSTPPLRTRISLLRRIHGHLVVNASTALSRIKNAFNASWKTRATNRTTSGVPGNSKSDVSNRDQATRFFTSTNTAKHQRRHSDTSAWSPMLASSNSGDSGALHINALAAARAPSVTFERELMSAQPLEKPRILRSTRFQVSRSGHTTDEMTATVERVGEEPVPRKARAGSSNEKETCL